MAWKCEDIIVKLPIRLWMLVSDQLAYSCFLEFALPSRCQPHFHHPKQDCKWSASQKRSKSTTTLMRPKPRQVKPNLRLVATLVWIWESMEMAPKMKVHKFFLLNFTFVVTKPEKVQLIQPPIKIIGIMLSMLPLSISLIIDGSRAFGCAVCLSIRFGKYPCSSSAKKFLRIPNELGGRTLPFSRSSLAFAK